MESVSSATPSTSFPVVPAAPKRSDETPSIPHDSPSLSGRTGQLQQPIALPDLQDDPSQRKIESAGDYIKLTAQIASDKFPTYCFYDFKTQKWEIFQNAVIEGNRIVCIANKPSLTINLYDRTTLERVEEELIFDGVEGFSRFILHGRYIIFQTIDSWLYVADIQGRKILKTDEFNIEPNTGTLFYWGFREDQASPSSSASTHSKQASFVYLSVEEFMTPRAAPKILELKDPFESQDTLTFDGFSVYHYQKARIHLYWANSQGNFTFNLYSEDKPGTAPSFSPNDLTGRKPFFYKPSQTIIHCSSTTNGLVLLNFKSNTSTELQLDFKKITNVAVFCCNRQANFIAQQNTDLSSFDAFLLLDESGKYLAIQFCTSTYLFKGILYSLNQKSATRFSIESFKMKQGQLSPRGKIFNMDRAVDMSILYANDSFILLRNGSEAHIAFIEEDTVKPIDLGDSLDNLEFTELGSTGTGVISTRTNQAFVISPSGNVREIATCTTKPFWHGTHLFEATNNAIKQVPRSSSTLTKILFFAAPLLLGFAALYIIARLLPFSWRAAPRTTFLR